MQKDALAITEAGTLKLSLENCLYALICGSLNPQEVGMAVQSIWASIQVRDMTSNHLLVPAREVAFGKMQGIGELNHLSQEIRTSSEALDNPGHLLPP